VRMFKRAEDGKCNSSEGSLLTFQRGTDTLTLSGRDDSRSQTATVTATVADTSCPAPLKR
jgi:hypothetical protein